MPDQISGARYDEGGFHHDQKTLLLAMDLNPQTTRWMSSLQGTWIVTLFALCDRLGLAHVSVMFLGFPMYSTHTILPNECVSEL